MMYLSMESMEETSEGRVLKMLEQGPVTPDEVAEALGTAWATAHGLLLKLEGEGRVRSARKGRVNVYFLKEARLLTPPMPSWARVRDLKELAEELEPYFAGAADSAAIIRKERRKA